MPIGDLWGIGRRLTNGSYSRRIHHRRFRQPSPDVGQVQTGRTVRNPGEIHGENCIELDFKKRKLQDSISERRARFPIDIDDFDYIRARVAIYCAHVSKTAAHPRGECGKVTVFLRKQQISYGKWIRGAGRQH